MVGAKPDTNSPNPNTPNPTYRGITGPYRSEIRPPITVVAIMPMTNSEKTQAYSSFCPRSAAAAGIAVLTLIASNAMASTPAHRPMISDFLDTIDHSITGVRHRATRLPRGRRFLVHRCWDRGQSRSDEKCDHEDRRENGPYRLPATLPVDPIHGSRGEVPVSYTHL